MGVLLWLLIFLEISLTMIGLKLSEITVWIIHYIFLIPAAILCAWLYYRSDDKLNGFTLGLLMVIVGIALDMITTVPYFVIPQGGSYLTYFSNYYMLIGFVELIIITGIYGVIKE